MNTPHQTPLPDPERKEMSWDEFQKNKMNYYHSNMSWNIIPEEENPISKFEKLYPNLAEAFLDIQAEQYHLFAKKMLGYGLSNISLGTNLETQEEKKLAITSIMIRCWDKVNRLKTLLMADYKNPLSDESIEDTWKDLSVYGIIAQLVSKGAWKK